MKSSDSPRKRSESKKSRRSAKVQRKPTLTLVPLVLPETSSEPSVIPQEQQKLFFEVLTLFEKKHIPYAVAGAFALQEHTGICRDTKDLDLFLTQENVGAALKWLRDEGFECEVKDPV